MDTPARAPPEGTWARVQPVAHDGPTAPEKVTSTWSTRPLWSLSAIWAAIIDCLAGAVVVVDDRAVVVVVPPGTVVAVVLRSGGPPMAIRAVAEWVLTGGSPL